MLPFVHALFTLLRAIAMRSPVTEIAVPKSLVRLHGLGPLAARSGFAEFRDELAVATIAWARIERELPPVVAGLVEAGVRVAPIKGLAYAKHLYATPAERPMADLDLLVPPAQIETARTVLGGLGFARGPAPVLHHAEVWFRDELVIDLHRSIIAPVRAAIDLDAVWSRTAPGWPSGAERLDATDALVFHYINLSRNRLLAPLVHLIDMNRLLEHADERAALERAKRWGVGAAVSLAHRFSCSLLETDAQYPGGRLGPNRDDVIALAAPGAVRKIAFDLAVAGSPRQLAARAVIYGANLLNYRFRR